MNAKILGPIVSIFKLSWTMTWAQVKLKSRWLSADVQASKHVLYRSFDLESLFIWTYRLISCSLSLADGAVHWQIKYCNGTAKTRTINWRTRGISATLTLKKYLHSAIRTSNSLTVWWQRVSLSQFPPLHFYAALLRRRVETKSP